MTATALSLPAKGAGSAPAPFADYDSTFWLHPVHACSTDYIAGFSLNSPSNLSTTEPAVLLRRSTAWRERDLTSVRNSRPDLGVRRIPVTAPAAKPTKRPNRKLLFIPITPVRIQVHDSYTLESVSSKPNNLLNKRRYNWRIGTDNECRLGKAQNRLNLDVPTVVEHGKVLTCQYRVSYFLHQ